MILWSLSRAWQNLHTPKADNEDFRIAWLYEEILHEKFNRYKWQWPMRFLAFPDLYPTYCVHYFSYIRWLWTREAIRENVLNSFILGQGLADSEPMTQARH